jgi:hypothetical protein
MSTSMLRSVFVGLRARLDRANFEAALHQEDYARACDLLEKMPKSVQVEILSAFGLVNQLCKGGQGRRLKTNLELLDLNDRDRILRAVEITEHVRDELSL